MKKPILRIATFLSLLFATTSAQAADTPATPPNIIVILADDLGWSDLGCYGGEIQTPTLDRLASQGIRFTQFYNSAKCEPTRASLMSGQYWQDTGLGVKTGITMGQAMRGAGYATFAVGKWHLDGNPTDRGFDHFFGHLSGASDYFKGDPSHRLDKEVFKPAPGFYTTDANADYAIRFIEQSKREHPEKPFFTYLAFNAPHGPIQAWPQDIAKYRGKYRKGWDAVRAARYQKMISLGMFKKEWPLSPRPDTIPAWDTLSEQEKDFEDLRMSIFAAMVDRMDQAIGRVLAKVKELGQEKNTLVMFLSDNGGSPYDRGRRGNLPNPGAKWEYGIGWANVSGTPYRHYKRNMSNGGACTPMIAYWPDGVKQPGTITDQRGHITDLMATLVDLSGKPWPAESEGKPLRPLPGKTLAPIFAGASREALNPLYFQLMDHRAIIDGEWKLVSDWGRPWELYNLANDRAETKNLATLDPARAQAFEKKWDQWWSERKPQNLKAAGTEPSYRSPTSSDESTQGGNDEKEQTGDKPEKKRLKKQQ